MFHFVYVLNVWPLIQHKNENKNEYLLENHVETKHDKKLRGFDAMF